MNLSYFDYKIKKYLVNILQERPEFILKSETTQLWHDLFNEKELVLIAKEIIVAVKLPDLEARGILEESTLKKEVENTSEEYLSPKRNNAKRALKNLQIDILSPEIVEEIFCGLSDIGLYYMKKISQIIITNIDKKLERKNIHVDERLLELQNLFKLNDVETELVTLYYCAEYFNQFKELVEGRNSNININTPKASKNFVSKIIKKSPQKVMNALSKSANLLSLGILDGGKCMEMSYDFVQYLSGFSGEALINKYAKNVVSSDSLSLDSHLVPANKIEILKAILESDSHCSILFYGKPGTGKTELAKSIAKAVGLELFAINILDGDGEDDRGLRKRSMFAVQNHPAVADQIILIDECDQLINSRPSYFFGSNSGDQKAWLNEYIDTNNLKTIWITNSISNIDDSVIRRFNYILEFSDLSNIQREKILNTISSKNSCSFLNAEDIKLLAKSEKLTSGHFSIALETVRKLKVSDSKKKEYFTNILTEHQNTLGQKPLRLKSINTNYCIRGLNIDQSPTSLIEHSKRILERIEQDDSDINLNILLYGPPGTGKTEFVKYLAQELGKEILLKRASDLLSMYVGGSEKNIRQAFEEAEKEKKILFIDEADSLMSSRDGHNRTWETTQVNEILTCMENFRGILLCATNHIDNLDMAAQRRFLFKLKFDYLNKDGVVHFYDKFFSTSVNAKISDEQIINLGCIQGLTPSDFNNLRRKFEIFNPQNHEDIFNQLQLEVSYKKNIFKKKLGFN